MAITQVSDLGDSVKARYEKAYLMHGDETPGVWGQFVSWQKPVAESGDGGSTFEYPVYDVGTPIDDALSETSDITPQTMDDGNISITPAEYGGSFATTKKLRYQAHTNLPEICGRKSSAQRILSIDRILRRAACGYGSTMPTNTIHIDNSATMADLTAASSTDTVTYDFLMRLVTEAASMGVEPFKNWGFVAPIHPTLALDIMSLTEFKTVGYYQDSGNLYSPWGKPFTLANITFIPTPKGKLYLGAGSNATSGADNTLNGALAKGATSVVVSSNATLGAAVGDYVTIETPETESVAPSSKCEQGLVTAVNSDTLTVRFNGANEDWGCRFAHDTGAHITVAYNVAAIPLLGKDSIMGVYGADCGPYGKTIVKIGDLDILSRFSYYSWYAYLGVTAVTKRIVLGKCAVSRFIKGWN